MSDLLTTEKTEELLYGAFRRAMGAWIVTSADGTVEFEIGEWADSPAACLWPSYADKTIKKVGWLAGSELGGSGPCGEDVAATTEEFAKFMMNEDFVVFGSAASIEAAIAFESN